MARVLVAMSGGVDSSVAAARLVDQGCEVVGVTLHLWDYPELVDQRGRCCAPEDLRDAARVSAQLGIAHYVFDRRAQFERRVVEPFVEGYLAGTTPSPCVECNRTIKFPELFRIADLLGAERVATGHYARIVPEHGRHSLHKGLDANKDQSYFLYALTPAERARIEFPLGAADKQHVRREAMERGLCGASKGESQELCFVPTGRYDALIERRAQARVRPGPIVAADGRILGQHRGIHRFTIGQRRNLGVAAGQRAYVVAIEPQAGVVRLGPSTHLTCESALVSDWVLEDDLVLPLSAQCAIRYRSQLHEACVERFSQQLRLTFHEPVRGVVPGQHAVLYIGSRVVGGGRIAGALPAAAAPGSPPMG